MESTTITPQNDRHRAVLDMLCQGTPRKEIAAKLEINESELSRIISIYRSAARVQTDTGLVLAIMQERWGNGGAA